MGVCVWEGWKGVLAIICCCIIICVGVIAPPPFAPPPPGIAAPPPNAVTAAMLDRRMLAGMRIPSAPIPGKSKPVWLHGHGKSGNVFGNETGFVADKKQKPRCCISGGYLFLDFVRRSGTTRAPPGVHRTCREPNGTGLTPIGVELNGSGHVTYPRACCP